MKLLDYLEKQLHEMRMKDYNSYYALSNDDKRIMEFYKNAVEQEKENVKKERSY